MKFKTIQAGRAVAANAVMLSHLLIACGCTKDMTTTQIAEIMRKEVQDKPAEWHLGMNSLGLNAMVTACRQYYSPPK